MGLLHLVRALVIPVLVCAVVPHTYVDRHNRDVDVLRIVGTLSVPSEKEANVMSVMASHSVE